MKVGPQKGWQTGFRFRDTTRLVGIFTVINRSLRVDGQITSVLEEVEVEL